MSRLDDAFVLAGEINRSKEMDGNDYNLLQLDCIDAHELSTWAATFDAFVNDDYWYEAGNIGKYATASRASTPEDAIFAAAEKFCKLTGFRPADGGPAVIT